MLDFVYFLYFATIFVANIVPFDKAYHATPLVRSDINVRCCNSIFVIMCGEISVELPSIGYYAYLWQRS